MSGATEHAGRPHYCGVGGGDGGGQDAHALAVLEPVFVVLHYGDRAAAVQFDGDLQGVRIRDGLFGRSARSGSDDGSDRAGVGRAADLCAGGMTDSAADEDAKQGRLALDLHFPHVDDFAVIDVPDGLCAGPWEGLAGHAAVGATGQRCGCQGCDGQGGNWGAGDVHLARGGAQLALGDCVHGNLRGG